MPAPSPEFVEALKRLDLPEWGSFANPLDLGGVSLDAFRAAVELADEAGMADVILLVYGDPIEGADDAGTGAGEHHQGQHLRGHLRRRRGREGAAMDDAAAAASPCSRRPSAPSRRSARAAGITNGGASWRPGDECDPRSLQLMLEPQAAGLLAEYGIEYVPHELATSADEAVAAAGRVGLSRRAQDRVARRGAQERRGRSRARPRRRGGRPRTVRGARRAGAGARTGRACRQASSSAARSPARARSSSWAACVTARSGRRSCWAPAACSRRCSGTSRSVSHRCTRTTGWTWCVSSVPTGRSWATATVLRWTSRPPRVWPPPSATSCVEHPEVAEVDLNPVLVLPQGCMVVDARIMTEG